MNLGDKTVGVVDFCRGTPEISREGLVMEQRSLSLSTDGTVPAEGTSAGAVTTEDRTSHFGSEDGSSATTPMAGDDVFEFDDKEVLQGAPSTDSTSTDTGPGSPLDGFFEETADLDTEVEMILNHPGLLRDEQLDNLHTILSEYLPSSVKYGADFDFNHEIEAQIVAVRAMRARVMTPGGQLKVDIPIREAKETLAAGTTLLQTLMKNHEKVMNFNRQRAIEEATIQAIRNLPQENQDQFFASLKDLLDGIE